VDAEEALRKKQERVRKWKEAKRLKEEEENKKKAASEVDEVEKKKLAIAAAEKEAEELWLKQKEALEKKKREEEEAAAKNQQNEEEPQLLQQFAAIRKAAAEAAAKEEEAREQSNDTIMTEDQAQDEMDDQNGKKWSLEDDSESDEDVDMDLEDNTTTQTEIEAERTFKPLQKPLIDVNKEEEEDSILIKPKKTFLMSNKSTKPKNAMRMGFGLGKSMLTMKKTTASNGTTTAVKKEVEKEKMETPEPVDTVMEDSEDIDPLEAYMLDVHAETKKINEEDKKRMVQMNKTVNGINKRRGSIVEDDEDIAPAKNNNAEDDEDIGSDPEDILA
jgi:ATP-dependent RNA helicase DDX46/PRP5